MQQRSARGERVRRSASLEDCEKLVAMMDSEPIYPRDIWPRLNARYDWNQDKCRSVIARAWDDGFINVTSERRIVKTVGEK